jgi:YjbE family integral membrane protein
MDISSPAAFALAVVQIIWIDLVLSGDNAVVIALACRNLPPTQRRIGIIAGAGVAVLLRILFALVVASLLGVPYLKLVGGALLFWIALKLVTEHGEGEAQIEGGTSLFAAIRTIAIADAVMSLDNVIAVAAASRGHVGLFVFALLLSIPLVVFGSQLILRAIDRFPVLIWVGAGILGFIVGEMLLSDVATVGFLQGLDPALVVSHATGEAHGGAAIAALEPAAWLARLAGALGVGAVLVTALFVRRSRRAYG